ncbi:hypothetical protein JSO62_06755 [Riemerella anatipestifer]|uniref:hypothetical protein n=1 Tax=Riemerella anatipestifer TaxID=34085 RepID=UPI0023648B6D|nr:hypothetical protein [Riemerella anatipestifer]MDD1596972.1 glycosyltransferase family 4 protein [Riemerella anatipestifer]MDY3338483.1 hypothetical protein [Riemerella anatipestifer]
MVLFVANYPTLDTIKEGMSQRIFAIDNQFESEDRCYLFVSHRMFCRKEVFEIKKGIKQYRCNLFLHFFFILNLFRKSRLVYFHSMLNAFLVFPIFFLRKKKTKYVLDVHGIVPEEQEMNGRRIRSWLYNLIEKKLFSLLDYAIVVTEQMKNFYHNKYPNTKNVIYIVYPIISDNILKMKFGSYEVKDIQKIEVIYSGNTQSWQNIPLMVELIKNNIAFNVNYTILTGDIENMSRMFLEKGVNIENSNIVIKSVKPEELEEYYKKANYGFILRDDIDVNRVACPTKMMEYLCYGVIPIVNLINIGDFGEYGYEYITNTDFDVNNLSSEKSKKNMKIASTIIDSFTRVNIREML